MIKNTIVHEKARQNWAISNAGMISTASSPHSQVHEKSPTKLGNQTSLT